jgi:hypothetical protein
MNLDAINERLGCLSTAIRVEIDADESKVSIDIDHPVYGRPFQFYWALIHPELLSQIGFIPVDEQSMFYAAYYWLLRFSKLYISRNGPDAGMEQYVFKFLERADLEIDWPLIERIDKLVELELAHD